MGDSDRSARLRIGAFITAMAFSAPLHAEMMRGAHEFATERHCAASGKLPADVCASAAANASAEFEEKAPRFSTREACQRVFRGGCAIGLRGAAVLFRELGEGDRRRVVLDPAPQLVDSGRRHGTPTGP